LHALYLYRYREREGGGGSVHVDGEVILLYT